IEENRVQDNVFRIVGAFKADLHSLATKIGGLSPKIRKFATEPYYFAFYNGRRSHSWAIKRLWNLSGNFTARLPKKVSGFC
ncbi:hypothetical protein, partial [Methylovulum psychrotolerans]|uniref:hypothetical protein n=1 Tax=Methylovulum psychrotolerans TaxID=1704499 RepID=UPI001B80C2E5